VPDRVKEFVGGFLRVKASFVIFDSLANLKAYNVFLFMVYRDLRAYSEVRICLRTGLPVDFW